MSTKKTKRPGSSLALKKNLEGLWFVLPAFLLIALLIGYPMIYNLILSFKNLDVRTFKGDTSVFVGWQNYQTLFVDKTFWLVLKNTFIFTIGSLIFQFTIGFLLALLFNQKFRLAGPIRGLLLVGYMMPVAVSALLFRNMFQVEGVINDLLLKIQLIKEPVQWLISENTALPAVIFANCWIGIPFNMLLLTTGLTNIPEDVYESAKIDGANAWQRFVYMTIPLLKSAMISVLTLGFIYTFKVFDLIYMMTGGGPLNSTDVLATYAYTLSFGKYEFSQGAAAANVMFFCLLFIGLFYLKMQGEDEE